MSSSVIGLVPVTPEPIGLRLPLPKLPYSLRTRKRAITIAWIFILLDSCFLPLSLFYILKYGAKLNDARSTSCFTISSKLFTNFIQVWEYQIPSSASLVSFNLASECFGSSVVLHATGLLEPLLDLVSTFTKSNSPLVLL